MHSATESDHTLPYEGASYNKAVSRSLDTPAVAGFLRRVYGDAFDAKVAFARGVEDLDELQRTLVADAIDFVVRDTTAGLTVDGLDWPDRARKHLIVSNHRCIIADASLVSHRLLTAGCGSLRICIGDNLLHYPWVADLVLLNNCIPIKRDAPPRVLLQSANFVSSTCRADIETGRHHVWISQRPGRTKDGDDQTDPTVLKMLCLAGTGERHESLARLHIRPAAISYEFEPCDYLMVREACLSGLGRRYVKQPDDDLACMHDEFHEWKGRVHLAFGDELPPPSSETPGSKNESFVQTAAQIDAQIRRLYRLWPSHLVAFDLLEGKTRMAHLYAVEAAAEFIDRMESRLARLEPDSIDRDHARRHFLALYAGPVVNALEAGLRLEALLP